MKIVKIYLRNNSDTIIVHCHDVAIMRDGLQNVSGFVWTGANIHIEQLPNNEILAVTVQDDVY